MRRLSLTWVLIGGGAVTAMTFLWIKTNAIDVRRHEGVADAMRNLLIVDLSLNDQVLKARFGLEGNYDDLATALAAVDGLSDQLAAGALGFSAAQSRQLTDALEAYADALDEKRSQIERFKSENAVLRNSLRYFPVAMGQLTSSPALEQDEELLHRIQALQRDTL